MCNRKKSAQQIVTMKGSAMDLALQPSRWLGIAPYVSTPEYQVSRTIDICGRIVFTFTNVVGLMLTIQQTFFHEHGIKLTVNFIHNCMRILVAITVLFGIYSASDRLRRTFQILKRLDQIDLSLASHHRRCSRKTFIILLIHIMSSDVIRIIGISILIYAHGLNFLVIIRIIRLLTFVIADFLELQYMAFAGRVLETLEVVNQCLEDLIHREHSAISTEEVKTENTVRQLALHYLDICDMVRSVTNSDGYMMMLLLVTHTMVIEISWHIVIVWLSDTSEGPSAFILLLILQSIVNAVTLTMFIEFFHQTHQQMERTHHIVDYLKYQRSDEEEVSNELELFNRMLMLYKTTYSPLSMFTLSRSLLGKIFGSIVTYLVIILTYSNESKIDVDSFL